MKKNQTIVLLSLFLAPILTYGQSFHDKCKIDVSSLIFENRLAVGEVVIDSKGFPYSEMKNLTEQQSMDFLNGRKLDAKTLLTVNYYEFLREATPKEIKQADANSSGSGKKLLGEVTGIKAISEKEKKEDETKVSNGKVWTKKQFRTFTNRPFILISDQATTISDGLLKPSSRGAFENVINLPPGVTPLDDLSKFDQKKMTLEKGIENSSGTICYILTDNVSRLYLFMTYDQAAGVLINTKLFNDINNLRNQFKNESLVLRQGKTFYTDIVLSEINQSKNALLFKVKTNTSEEKTIELQLKDKKGFKDTFYKRDCYTQSVIDFNNQTIPNDFFTDNALKTQLTQAFSKSQDWADFELIKLILTNQSVWRQHKGQYKIVTEGRAMTAFVYVKSKTTGECLVDKEIYFYQRNDAVRGFIFPIEVASQPNLEEFPCKK